MVIPLQFYKHPYSRAPLKNIPIIHDPPSMELLDYLLTSSGFGDFISPENFNLEEGTNLDSSGKYANSEDFMDQVIFLNSTDSVEFWRGGIPGNIRLICQFE